MDGWWDELDGEIVAILDANGPKNPADVARKLGMSTEAVCTSIGMLVTEGRVRIRSAAAAPARGVRVA